VSLQSHSLQTAAALHNQLHQVDDLGLYWDGEPLPGEEEGDYDGVSDVYHRIEATLDDGEYVPRFEEADEGEKTSHEWRHTPSHAAFKAALITHFDHEWRSKRISWPKRFGE
jgi:hypothetical protein